MSEAYHARWEAMWGSPESVQPGDKFDARGAAPSFRRWLASADGQAAVNGKTAVVPGCGRGYDMVALTAAGASEAVGVEISPSAAQVAAEYCKMEAPDAAIRVVTADWLKGDAIGTFDVGFDYTFFCALHPVMRANWAEAWARNLRPGGTLVTLVFPLEAEGREGPPWPVQKDAYSAVLSAQGFSLESYEAVAPEEATAEARVGKEALAVWRKT